MKTAAALTLAFLVMGCSAAEPARQPPAPPAEVRGVASRPAAQADAPSGVAYVVNQNSDDVVAIDVDARSIIGRSTTGRNPHEIVGSPDGSRLFTSDQQGNTISVFETSSLRRVDTWAGGAAPHGIEMTADGRYLLVTNETRAEVLVLDAETGAIVGRLSAELGAHVIHRSPDGARAYVTNTSGSLTVLDLNAMSTLRTIPMGAAAEGLGVSPDGRWVYVANRDADDVWVVDAAILEVVDRIAVHPNPIRIVFSPDSSTAYVSQIAGERILAIDTATRAVIGSFTAGSGPIGMAVSPDGRYLYAANIFSGNLSVINIATGITEAQLPAGDGPDGMVLLPRPG